MSDIDSIARRAAEFPHEDKTPYDGYALCVRCGGLELHRPRNCPVLENVTIEFRKELEIIAQARQREQQTLLKEGWLRCGDSCDETCRCGLREYLEGGQ